jgi:DNA invertase Pin-like site-specific DNA recombinase
MNETINCCLYARCSTLLNQDPENQLIHLRQFAIARGFKLVKEFVDHGISGAKERRPALDEMVGLARQGKIKIIITTSLDRISRDTRHLLNLIEELNHYGISIISLRENLDFSTPLGKATLTIIGAISSLERELTRERIKSALAAKKMAAERIGKKFNIGRPTVISEELLLKIRSMKTQGISIRKIADSLNVGKSTVQRILKSGK